ncbi:hypothetical protein PR048_025253 [Dryococelus australis]|uniref:Uncharacterized protein n=1 Tax=Dryococelus australis TaxID=614101 RepID=A0ABQ9GQX1_9NEOP|nr:hypothetical protein PR048_025253 [Dryococelus australis]
MAETSASTAPNLMAKLNLEGNVHENWVRSKQHFIVYLGASDNDTKVPDNATAAAKKKISKRKTMLLLLNVTGKDAIDLASTFGLSDKELDNYDKLIETFGNYAAPQKE